ncbi:MAG: hypothetical protein WBQ52_13165, partial [Terracidiphilus sp.]
MSRRIGGSERKTAIMKGAGKSERHLSLSSQKRDANMARKKRDWNFEEMLDELRGHGFEVTPDG